MKTIHAINQVATGFTIALYFTVIGGMYAQVILGPLQLLLAAIITYKYYKKLDKYTRRQLNQYWMAATIALVLAGISLYFIDDFFFLGLIFTLFVLPMVVAIYFTIVTANINANFKNLRHEIQ